MHMDERSDVGAGWRVQAQAGEMSSPGETVGRGPREADDLTGTESHRKEEALGHINAAWSVGAEGPASG